MTLKSARGWLASDNDGLASSGRGRSGHARALHGGWRNTDGVVDGLPLHRKLSRRRLAAF